MTRFTKYEGKQAVFADPYNEGLRGRDLMQLLLYRLARYEDTGMTPSEIHALSERARSVEQMTGLTLAKVRDLARADASLRLRCVVDAEICSGTAELKKVLQEINNLWYEVITVTQYGDTFIVFFRRPADG